MEKDIKNIFNDLTVYYVNQLARMCSKFTLEEEKVIHLIFSQIKPFEKNDTIFKLNKLDFFNKLELKSEDKYTRYASILERLINKTFVKLRDEKGNSIQGYVVSASRWNVKEAFFEVEISKMFMPYLEQLKEHYTKLQLDSILKLKAKHSLTLYKWLCSWTDESKQENQRYITTKDLKELLGLSINDYVYNDKFNRADFERRTIKLATKEIKEKTNFNVSFKKIKKGNKVLNYEFTWKGKYKVIAEALYKFLCSWTDESKQENQRYITTKDLIKLFGLNISDYVYNDTFNHKLFETKIINNVINKINAKTNLTVSYKKNKENEIIKNYEFFWKEKGKIILNSVNQQIENVEEHKQEKKKKFNFTEAEIKQILKEFDEH